ncbi:hypothetical protein JCM33374_g1666 [Metschnikowia sp. JCM 33374]|nr:hypothetical protein JCM33374_g1666 [Metschnikowia sp. JCM 33374]
MTIGLVHPPQAAKSSLSLPTDGCGVNMSYYRCFQNYYHGHQFLNPDPQYIPNVRLSINHWQIRDLVQIDSATGQVFHTVDENIRVLSMKSRRHKLGSLRSRNYVSLPYRPRCFHHAPGGLVVTGGVLTTSSKAYSMNLPALASEFACHSYRKQAKGLFSVYRPGMEQEMTFQLGDMINNAVKIYPQQNTRSAYTAYACNNDSGLYMVDISNSGIRGKRRIICEANTSLNNVHRSNDGRIVTATGDSGSIFLLDTASPHPVAKTITTPHDSGFGISYHSNEVVFAVAFQDGTCTMFDLRNTSVPLHEIHSTRPGHSSGAFRTCRFVKSPIQDLLVISEHLGRVHLIDSRDFSAQNHQVMVFPFALDQYARYRQPETPGEDDGDTDVHSAVSVYTDETAHFTAPLVYDYEYLVDVNPKLFKGFTYEPQQGKSNQKEHSESVNDHVSSEAVSMSADCVTERPADSDGIFSYTPTRRRDRAWRQNSRDFTLEGRDNREASRHGENSFFDAQSYRNYMRQSQESYQQSVNHVNGEMEIAGLDWNENQLFVGCEDGGLLAWDVNVRARRSFGSFSYV